MDLHESEGKSSNSQVSFRVCEPQPQNINMATNGVNGKKTTYSIPQETQVVFQDGILRNPLIATTLPKEIEECARAVRFEGADRPSIPINWRFAESISALKGLEAAMVNVLLKRKYNLEPQEAVINT
jgi:hypothetical protein